ncbi:MAG: Tm-1-like ATP-binding domain-containing protein [Desulfatiglandaceae bacterium]
MGAEQEKKAVLIIATMDTKGEEVIYLKNRIEENGLGVVILDTGILGEPKGITPDIPASETANAAGTTLEEMREKPSRGEAVDEMLKGAKVITAQLFQQGRVHGAISLGGAEGSVMAAAAMQILPPGFPKVIITPLASGARSFGPFVGIRDIMVMHSLLDIAGINDISRSIFDNAGAAISGMVHQYRPMEVKGDNLVPITTLGTTDRAMRFIFRRLQNAGYVPIIFHTSGVGGQVMEDMIGRGFFCGVVDLCTNELTDNLVGGFHDAGPHRLEAASRTGIPQVIVPGCQDFFALGPPDTVPEKWRERKKYYHNPAFTLIRPSVGEMKEIGSRLGRKVNKATGPVIVVLPLRGMSIGGLEGGSTYDPEGDRAFFETLKESLRPDIPVIEEKMHINEEAFADRVFEAFQEVMAKGSTKSTKERR